MNASTSQRGAVLIVALVFMLIISVLGVASMRNATMQERMAGNNKDINIAFQAAEAAVREAEAAMDALASIDFDGSNGLYLSCPDTTDTRTACSEPDWQQRASTGWKGVDDELSNVLRQPEYIIEQISATADPGAALDSDRTISTQGYYRVTARGFGQSDRTMVVLTTTYRREES